MSDKINILHDVRSDYWCNYLSQVHQVGNFIFITVPIFTVVLQDKILSKTNK